MKRFVDMLYDLMKESTITQSLLVILIFGPLGYCVFVSNPLPQDFINWGYVIIGFFFGAKATYQIMKGR